MTGRWEYLPRESVFRCVDEHDHVLAWLTREFVVQMADEVDRGRAVPPVLLSPIKMLPRYEPEDC